MVAAFRGLDPDFQTKESSLRPPWSWILQSAPERVPRYMPKLRGAARPDLRGKLSIHAVPVVLLLHGPFSWYSHWLRARVPPRTCRLKAPMMPASPENLRHCLSF